MGGKTELAPAKHIKVSLVVMTWIESEGDTNAKNERSRDIWSALESKTHSNCDIPEELWGDWPMKEEVDITYDCKERNF